MSFAHIKDLQNVSFFLQPQGFGEIKSDPILNPSPEREGLKKLRLVYIELKILPHPDKVGAPADATVSTVSPPEGDF